ncbi:class I SAM-dependent methyltransferase [Erythrobacter alti]|uniref:class I SAM-dependent methyltransferase n=1 Tax=Erythrobacter alti TaxID=1896145 RepID=UPI0030F49564
MTSTYHSNVRTDIIPLVLPSKRLLDVGGGIGTTALHLKEIGRAEQVGVIDAVIKPGTAGVDFQSNANLDKRSEVEPFLTENGPFDTILLLDVLEHLVDPWDRVDQFAKHLSTGGALIASIPNVRHISLLRDLIFRNRWNYADAGLLDRTHLRFFTKESALELLQRAGLTIETVRSSAIGAPKQRLFNKLTFGRFRSFFTTQYLIVARREQS